VAVHSHPDRWLLGATAVEAGPRVASERLLSSSAWAKSIGWIDSGHGDGITTWFAASVKLDVGDQPAMRQQAERVESHAQRARGRSLKGTRVAGRHHLDRRCAKLAA
jgi:hypothetical protein